MELKVAVLLTITLGILASGCLDIIKKPVAEVQEISDEAKETMEGVQETLNETQKTMETMQNETRELSKEVQETLNETQETMKTMQKKLENPEIIDLKEEISTTSATISWETTKATKCTLKVMRLGKLRFNDISTMGTVHSQKVRALLPDTEYEHVIDCTGATGSVNHKGTFKTKKALDWPI